MSTGISVTKDGIKQALNKMLKRSNQLAAYMQRVILPQYYRAQEQRWITENTSEGAAWHPILPSYAAWKRRKYASAPGSGQKLMVATSRLSFAATGRSPSDGYKLITDTAFVVGINDEAIPYAKHVAKERPIMEFSDATINKWKNQIYGYVINGA